MSLKFFFSFILAGLLCTIVSSSPAAAGPIFPEQARREEALMTSPVAVKIFPVIVKNTGKKMETLFTIDTRDGLNADEAALLAILINPNLVGLRKKKGLSVPQLIESGVLPPIRLLAEEGVGAVSWLPPERLQVARDTVRAIQGGEPNDSLDLEAAWLEWQTFEGARLHLYRKINRRRIIDLLRQIRKLYKEIYKATSQEKFREQYPELRATAKLGYAKMKKAIKNTRTELSAARVDLDHALGLPTYVEVPLEHDVSLPMPDDLPTAKELTDNLNTRRIDFLAFQKGLREKDVELLNYIHSRFTEINIFISAITPSQWLDTRWAALDMDLPIFSGNMGIAAMQATDNKLLFKDYTQRIKTAKKDIQGLLQGIGFIRGELEKIEKTLPALIKAARETNGRGNTVKALQKKKTMLAVKLLRQRLTGRLMDATIALEIASGRRLVKTTAP